MIAIELQDVKFFAFHGLYEGEQKTGNTYVVNLQVRYEEKDRDFEDISDTINYADLFTIVKKRMQIPAGLLERVCDSIIRHIKHQYPFISEVEISIFKLAAPIPELEGKVGVRMTKKYND